MIVQIIDSSKTHCPSSLQRLLWNDECCGNCSYILNANIREELIRANKSISKIETNYGVDASSLKSTVKNCARILSEGSLADNIHRTIISNNT